MIYSQIKKPTSLDNSQSPTWTNSTNILVDDGNLAESPSVAHQGFTPFLNLSNCDGDQIPFNASIVGVVARIKGKNELNTSVGFHCVGVSGGTGSGGLRLLGVDAIGRGMPSFVGNKLTTKVIGGDSDLWGASSITPAQVNSPDFGIYAAFKNGNTTSQKMFLDVIELEVFFTLPDPDQPIGGNGPVKPE